MIRDPALKLWSSFKVRATRRLKNLFAGTSHPECDDDPPLTDGGVKIMRHSRIFKEALKNKH